jgi:Asp-tRNA(Asn)/Glu-tRNA(Gln) amidotransferase A subunit family amidase
MLEMESEILTRLQVAVLSDEAVEETAAALAALVSARWATALHLVQDALGAMDTAEAHVNAALAILEVAS